MKKIILYSFVSIITAAIIYSANIGTANTRSAGAPNFVSGSPHDVSTCALSGCHNAYPVKNTPTHWISSNIPVTGYIPGSTYTITCKAVSIVSGQNSNFGFECTPENKTGTLIGTLANIATSGKGATQIISSSPSKWVTHTSTSYTGTDSCFWSFKWTSPAVGVGSVEFYSTFNCGSSDSRTTAQIYRDSVHFNQDSVAGIASIEITESTLNIYPNPIKSECTLHYTLPQTQMVEVNLYSISGKMIATLLHETEQSAGTHDQLLNIPTISAGIYLLQFTAGDQTVYKKVVVE